MELGDKLGFLTGCVLLLFFSQYVCMCIHTYTLFSPKKRIKPCHSWYNRTELGDIIVSEGVDTIPHVLIDVKFEKLVSWFRYNKVY